MPSRRADYYRKKAEECRLHAAGAKHSEVEESWQKLAAQWERLARGLDGAGQQAQQQQMKGLDERVAEDKEPEFRAG